MPPRHGEPARLRLLCWAYAGLGPSLFAPWARSAPEGLAVYGVQPPGRERRLREPPLDSLQGMLDGLVGALEAEPGFLQDGAYALLGCSFGAIAAFELARRLAQRGHPPPVCLTVIACRPPHSVHPLDSFSKLDDRALLERLDRDYGGVPQALKDEPEILALLVPALRGDLTALERYVPPDREARLPCPIHALGGDSDRAVPQDLLAGWLAHGADGSRLTVLPGRHFLVRDDPQAVLTAVRQALPPTTAIGSL